MKIIKIDVPPESSALRDEACSKQVVHEVLEKILVHLKTFPSRSREEMSLRQHGTKTVLELRCVMENLEIILCPATKH